MKHFIQSPRRQRGAALVIGLILLLVLTLLAVTSMNTASTELVMAGNEQYRQNAFQAAETGIEQALVKLPGVNQATTPQTIEERPVTDSTTDRYIVTGQYMGSDYNLRGFSAGKFVGFHYQLTSTGASARNAASLNVQGAVVIQNAGSGPSFTSINE